jgi:uncharacterized protein (DUF2342 family)
MEHVDLEKAMLDLDRQISSGKFGGPVEWLLSAAVDAYKRGDYPTSQTYLSQAVIEWAKKE